VLPADDVPLGTVIVTLVPVARAHNLTDSEALRAAVLSGVAMSTNWLSVGDATAVVGLVGAAGAATAAATNVTEAAAATVSNNCGEDGDRVTYIISLAPAVLPTASQAAQLKGGVANEIDKQLKAVSLPARVVNASVTLDPGVYLDRAAPFPANARAGSGNVMQGWLRATGINMDLCPAGVGLAAVRRLVREDLVTSAEAIEKTAANDTALDRKLPQPARLHNVANTRIGERIKKKGGRGGATGSLRHVVLSPSLTPSVPTPLAVRIVPAYDIKNTPDVALDSVDKAGGVLPDVIDMLILVEGLSREQAVKDMDAVRTASRNNKFAREMGETPGLSSVSVGHTSDW
jgi:hypothetical protein